MIRLSAITVLLASVMLVVAADPPKPPKPLPDGTEKALAQIPQFKLPPGMKAELWAAEPQLSSPVAISVDEKGRVYVAEEYRLGAGAAENRSNPAFDFRFFLDDDLQIRTPADRLAIYHKHEKKLPGGFSYFSKNADQIRRLEDTTGSGRANQSTIFAGGFNDPLDGLCAGVLAYQGHVYVTNIPNLYKLTDSKATGIADKKETLLTGFGPNIAFYGHDLHGLIMGPDGRLYFSVGDRGYNVKSKEGQQFEGPRNGAVFRCNPDGTEFEVVHRGLRNPQELAFDQYGNLFADDNNCDKGDHARLVYICDGGTSGWNMSYQSIVEPYLTGPWHAERLWHLPHQGQAAYIVPPVGSIGTGPSGFLFTSGTMLAKKYENSFLMCNFTGYGGLESFKVKQKGAGYEITDYHDFLKPIRATDAEFGPDGKLYISDFIDLNWDGRSAGGRIYTVFDPEKLRDPVIVQTKTLFEEGFSQRKPEELSNLLSHPDMRVRQRAQFALVELGELESLKKAASSAKSLYARFHAIWGLGQLAKSKPNETVQALQALLIDADPEVRAQAVKTLGDRHAKVDSTGLIKLLEDPAPRVQFFAAEALGKLKVKSASPGILKLLRANADTDPFLRHAAVTALSRIGDLETLQAHEVDKSASVRLGVVLAYRQLSSTRLSVFLDDADLVIRTEAARAIHDLPVESEYPKLAAVLGNLGMQALPDADALLRRAIHANYRLGRAENAKAILGLITNPNASTLVRSEALACLRDWAEPSPRDRVTGFWRPLPKRDAAIAKTVTQLGLNDLLSKTQGTLQIEAIQLVSQLGLDVDRKSITAWIADDSRTVPFRAAALRLLASTPGGVPDQVLTTALHGTYPDIAIAARDILATVDPKRATKELATVLGRVYTTPHEQQQAIATLSRMKNAEAVSELDKLASKLSDGTLAPELRVDVIEAIKAAPNPRRTAAVKKFESTLKTDPVGKFEISLTGGDLSRGRDLFFNHTGGQCVRCHKIGGAGGTAGPDLTEVAKRNPTKTREYILESMVLPNAKIAKGYASVTLTLIDGRSLAGVIQDETKTTITLLLPDGKTVLVDVADIEKRTTPLSAMPSVEKVFSSREMRDLIEFLSSCK